MRRHSARTVTSAAAISRRCARWYASADLGRLCTGTGQTALRQERHVGGSGFGLLPRQVLPLLRLAGLGPAELVPHALAGDPTDRAELRQRVRPLGERRG